MCIGGARGVGALDHDASATDVEHPDVPAVVRSPACMRYGYGVWPIGTNLDLDGPFSDRLERAPRLAEVDPVVPGGEAERHLVAFRAALRVAADSRAV
jgi:hypothetical protein